MTRLRTGRLMTFYCYEPWVKKSRRPPAAVRIWPVTKAASGETRKATTAAMSSGDPMRPSMLPQLGIGEDRLGFIQLLT